MAGVKITTFLGKAPKISPELLPNTAAQTVENCKLYSGDLIPYPRPVVADNAGQTGTIKTLYALRNPNDPDDLKWLAWPTEVDIVVASENFQDEQRFYYTGDGVPRVSNYERAIAGGPPYPDSSYDLGLPIPLDSQKLTTTATPFTAKTITLVSRDTSNIATVYTGTDHGLRTGNFATVSGITYKNGTYSQSGTAVTVTLGAHGLLTGATVTLEFLTGSSGTPPSGVYTVTVSNVNVFTLNVATSVVATSGDVRLDIRNFNATNVEVTVTGANIFTYFSPGSQIALTAVTGTLNLGGLTQARSYVFTWFTPWGEESIASKPSDTLFIKEGTIVTVDSASFPTTGPLTTNNFVRGLRLYRTLASTSGTEYFRLATLWFPTQVVNVQRTSNVSRVTLTYPHNFDVDDRFKISGCTDATFNIGTPTPGVVTAIIDDYTFEYAQVAADVPSTAVVAGTLYHDVSENPPTSTPRYWGDGSYDFIDDFDSRNLLDILESDEYDPPPADLRGLTATQNGVLAGFVGNTLYFSEPDVPHAWPVAYATPIGEDIVALAPIAGSLLVLTKGYPYLVSVTDPASGVSVSRVDALYPCLSAQSVVAMGYGIVWSTIDGLAVFSPSLVATLVTKLLYNNDTWLPALDPNTIVAEYYGENYFASHSAGSFVFEQDAKIGGFFVDTPATFTASWYDSRTGRLYYVSGTDGDIYEWDSLSQPPLTMQWKSKVIVTKDMINPGAARVIADYAKVAETWDGTTSLWEATPVDWDTADQVTFKLWADKKLIFTTTVTDVQGFRLPTGYRTDTFEIGVEGNVRIRAIHLAETMYGLREV